MRKIFYIFLLSALFSLVLVSNDVFAYTMNLPGVEKTEPADGASTGSFTPTLKWKTVSGANAYEIIIRDFNISSWTGGAIKWDVFINNVTSKKVPAGILAEGSYSWCVRAVKTEDYPIDGHALLPDTNYSLAQIESKILDMSPDCKNNSVISSTSMVAGECDMFSTRGEAENPPAVPKISSPGAGKTVFPLNLKWSSVSYPTAIKYQWRVEGYYLTDPTPSAPTGTKKTLPGISGETSSTQVEVSSKDALQLFLKGHYTLHVKACAGVNCSAEANSSEFTVSLDKFSLKSPENNSLVATNVTLTWYEAEGAESYRVYWMGVGSGTWSSVAVSIPNTKTTITGLTLDKTYSWYVVAIKRETNDPAANTTEFTSAEQWKFTPKSTGAPPGSGGTPPPGSGGTPPPGSGGTPGPTGSPAVPTDLSPCNNQTNISLTPTLKWKDVGAYVYYVFITSLPRLRTSSPSLTINAETLSLVSTSMSSLEEKRAYLWSVKACNLLEDKCSESATCTFSTKGAAGGTTGGTPGGGIFSTPAECKTTGADCPAGQICNPLRYNSIECLISAVTEFMVKLSVPIAVVMFVISGILFVISTGDPERVRTAKRMMIYTAVGFAVILVASGLIRVLQSLLQRST